MKKLSTILLAAYAMGGGFAQGGFEAQPLSDEEKRERETAILKIKGLKEFEINGKIYFAINYKNALKKSKKL